MPGFIMNIDQTICANVDCPDGNQNNGILGQYPYEFNSAT